MVYRGEGYLYYDFYINSFFKLGMCEIDKSEGKVVLEIFYLQCNDWYDMDLLLIY